MLDATQLPPLGQGASVARVPESFHSGRRDTHSSKTKNRTKAKCFVMCRLAFLCVTTDDGTDCCTVRGFAPHTSTRVQLQVPRSVLALEGEAQFQQAPTNQLFRADVGTTETVCGEITTCGQSQLVVMTSAASIILLAAKACCPTVHWARVVRVLVHLTLSALHWRWGPCCQPGCCLPPSADPRIPAHLRTHNPSGREVHHRDPQRETTLRTKSQRLPHIDRVVDILEVKVYRRRGLVTQYPTSCSTLMRMESCNALQPPQC